MESKAKPKIANPTPATPVRESYQLLNTGLGKGRTKMGKKDLLVFKQLLNKKMTYNEIVWYQMMYKLNLMA